MISGMGRPLIVIYGSYAIGIRGDCSNHLRRIVDVGRADSRLAYLKKSIVADLDFHIDPPAINSADYMNWIMEKSNHYLETSDFNAIFILQGCDNSTPLREAEYALDHGYESKTMIIFEMSEDNGENSACSLYTQATWRTRFHDIPIAFIEYDDFKSAWTTIMGKFLS